MSAVALALAAGPAAAAVPKDFVGIDSKETYAAAIEGDVTTAASNLSAQVATGIHIHRQPFLWEEIETSPGNYDFTATDAYMAQMAAKGMRVLPVLFDAPSWQTKGKDRPSKGIFAPPKSGKALGKFGAALIHRYGPNGSFWAGQPSRFRANSAIRSWQIWNESNLRFYWGGKPNAKEYVAVLKGASTVMKKADRKAEIVTAGIPQSTTRGAIGLEKYIDQMYAAGAKKWFDTMGLNAYAKNSKDLLAKISLVRSRMKKGGDAKAPLWITEIGWADKGSKHYLVKGAKGQAREIKNSIALIKKLRKSARLRGFIYYQWRDQPPYRAGIDPGTWGFHAGLLRKDGSFKPAYKAFKTAVAKL